MIHLIKDSFNPVIKEYHSSILQQFMNPVEVYVVKGMGISQTYKLNRLYLISKNPKSILSILANSDYDIGRGVGSKMYSFKSSSMED